MDENIKDLLEEEIRSSFGGLEYLDAGSSEKSTVIKDLAVLYKLKIEETKNQLDFEEKRDALERDIQLKERELCFKESQMRDMDKDRCIKIVLETAGIILPMIFYAAWMKSGFKFEETGTFTSPTFRGLFSRFKPTNR